MTSFPVTETVKAGELSVGSQVVFAGFILPRPVVLSQAEFVPVFVIWNLVFCLTGPACFLVDWSCLFLLYWSCLFLVYWSCLFLVNWSCLFVVLVVQSYPGYPKPRLSERSSERGVCLKKWYFSLKSQSLRLSRVHVFVCHTYMFNIGTQ